MLTGRKTTQICSFYTTYIVRVDGRKVVHLFRLIAIACDQPPSCEVNSSRQQLSFLATTSSCDENSFEAVAHFLGDNFLLSTRTLSRLPLHSSSFCMAASGGRTRPLRCCVIRVLSSASCRCATVCSSGIVSWPVGGYCPASELRST